MPTAICTECGHEQDWKATRGTRLKDIPCEECGGKLRRRTKEERKANRARVWAKVNADIAVLHSQKVTFHGGRYEDLPADLQKILAPPSIESAELRRPKE